MKQLFYLFIFLPILLASDITFKEWLNIYSKTYETNDQYVYREKIWKSNLDFIKNYNRISKDHQLAMNEFGDITWTEFSKLKLGYLSNAEKVYISHDVFIGDLPKYVNWTDKGVVTHVKNQMECGSCWAFSTTGVVESMHAIKTGKLVSLSEENLIDCSFNYGNDGCGGGLPSQALDYIIANGGIDTEESYPLSSFMPFDCIQQYMCPCLFKKATVGATVNGYKNIIPKNETDLQYAIANIGPISVAIDATEALQFYSSGVFSDKKCSSDILNHAVLVVGFGITNNGKEYYIVKNSWGTSWGMNGYFLLARNENNMCGIATNAVYPY